MDKLCISNARCWYSGTDDLTINNSRGTWRSKYMGYYDNDLWLIYDMSITCLPEDCVEGISNSYLGVMKLITSKSSSSDIVNSITGHICHYNETAKLSGPFKAHRLSQNEAGVIDNWNNIKMLVKSYLGQDPDNEDKKNMLIVDRVA